MLNNKKKKFISVEQAGNKELFFLNPVEGTANLLISKSYRQFFQFALTKEKSNLFYSLTSKFVREYPILEAFSRDKTNFIHIKLSQNLLLVKNLLAKKFSFFSLQLEKNKGGTLAAGSGFISFIPRRYISKKSREFLRFINVKINFRRYRKFSFLYSLRVNLISAFKIK